MRHKYGMIKERNKNRIRSPKFDREDPSKIFNILKKHMNITILTRIIIRFIAPRIRLRIRFRYQSSRRLFDMGCEGDSG